MNEIISVKTIAEENVRKFKNCCKRQSEFHTAAAEARADLIMYKALESGVIEAIKASIDKDGHPPVKEMIFNTQALWGDVLRSLTSKIIDTEEYLADCVEEEQNARKEAEALRATIRSYW